MVVEDSERKETEKGGVRERRTRKKGIQKGVTRNKETESGFVERIRA